jgi:hypothetical protein
VEGSPSAVELSGWQARRVNRQIKREEKGNHFMNLVIAVSLMGMIISFVGGFDRTQMTLTGRGFSLIFHDLSASYILGILAA